MSDDDSPTGKGATFTPVEFTGDDVILDMGCSPQWAMWVINGYTSCRDGGGDVVEGEILLKEDDGWGVVTAARDTFVDQLNGGAPTRLLEDAGVYRYTLGFSAEHAREMVEKLDSALEAGVAEYQMKVRMHISTLEGLVGQLQAQVNQTDD